MKLMMRNTQIIKRANCVLVLFRFAFLLLFFYRILLGKKPNPTPQSNRMLTSDCGGRNQYQTASWVYNKPKSSASFIILSHRLLGDELKVPNEATKKPTQTPTQMKEIDGWIVLAESGEALFSIERIAIFVRFSFPIVFFCPFPFR